MRDKSASPDRDVVDAMCKAYAEATGYYVEFHPGLKSISADKMRVGMAAALATIIAAPPRTEDAGFRAGIDAAIKETQEWLDAVKDQECDQYSHLAGQKFGYQNVLRSLRAISPRPTAEGTDQDAAGMVEAATDRLRKAVGTVLTWKHDVCGVSVVRGDFMDGLKQANSDYYDALNRREGNNG